MWMQACFSDPAASFGSPVDLLIIPDHYITRMLYSQGIPLESLGVPSVDGGPVEKDHRKIWRSFCGNFHLFRGTPSGLWLETELSQVFGIDEKPSLANADRLYDLIANKLATPAFTPRRLFERFNIEVLCTTNAATEPLSQHLGHPPEWLEWRILPNISPGCGHDPGRAGWRSDIDRLSQVRGVDVTDFRSLLACIGTAAGKFSVRWAQPPRTHGVLEPADGLRPGSARG